MMRLLKYKAEDGASIFATPIAEQRFDALIEKIHTYNPAFDKQKILDAIHWGRSKLNGHAAHLPEEIVSDRLTVAEKMVRLAKADAPTIIASFLYYGPLSDKDLGEVAGRFGKDVHDVVCATRALTGIQFRMPAHLYLNSDRVSDSPEDTAEQERLYKARKKHVQAFRYMALFASTAHLRAMPAAILIRGTEYLEMVENRHTIRDKSTRENLEFKIEHIYAPLLNYARFEDVQRTLLDQVLRLRDPKRFEAIQRVMSAHIASGQAQRKNRLDTLKDEVLDAVSKRAGIPVKFLTVAPDHKRPYSTDRKMKEKGIGLDQLPIHIHDLSRVRIEIDVKGYRDHMKLARRPHQSEREAYLETEYTLCQKTHAALARSFEPVLVPFKSPKDKKTYILKDGSRVKSLDFKKDKNNIIWVSAFKDYMKKPNAREREKIEKEEPTPVLGPKDNNYMAMHDVRKINGGEVDVQIVTKERHEAHTYGLSAQGDYKVADYKSERSAGQPLIDWYAAIGKTTGNPVYHTGAYRADNQIVLRPGCMTVAEFALGSVRGTDNEAQVLSCVGASRIERNELFADPNAEGLKDLALDAKIKPGDRVFLRFDEGAPNDEDNRNALLNALRRPEKRHVASLIENTATRPS